MHVGHPMFLMDSIFPEEPNGEPAWESLPEPLKRRHREYIAELDGNDGQPCYWLDEETRQCMHYEHRPRVCREFELGGEDCRRFVAAQLTEEDNE